MKQQLARLVNILFPELENLVPSLHLSSVYALLEEFPGASYVAKAHITRLSNLLCASSKGHYKKDKAAIGTKLSLPTCKRNVPRESITTLPYLMR